MNGSTSSGWVRTAESLAQSDSVEASADRIPARIGTRAEPPLDPWVSASAEVATVVVSPFEVVSGSTWEGDASVFDEVPVGVVTVSAGVTARARETPRETRDGSVMRDSRCVWGARGQFW